MPSFPPGHARCFAFATAVMLAASACTDRNPAGPGAPPSLAPTPAAAVLACTADVRAGTLACVPQGPSAGVSAAILGGQGTNVRLVSSGASYDGIGIFRADVTVANLTAQPLGTADGVTAAAEGVRVFFNSGPSVTGGSGTVSVANADGEDVFTAAAQPFFRYPGILEPGDTTPAREWRFALPSTVTTFAFTVYVAAAVPREQGSVGISPIAPSLTEGATMQLAPTVRTVTGSPVAGARVTWATSNPIVATVDSTGLVTAVAPGLATITATSGGRTGSVSVDVTPVWYPAPTPTIVGIELPHQVTANGVDSLWIRVSARVTGTELVRNLDASFVDPAGWHRLFCLDFALESGTVQDGVFRCAVAVPNGWRGGVWQVEHVGAFGGFDGRALKTAEVAAAGAPTRVHVLSPNEDTVAPVVHIFAIGPDSVTAGSNVGAAVKTTDVGLGATAMAVTFLNPTSGQSEVCSSSTRIAIADTIAFSCQIPILPFMRGGTWIVESLQVFDANNTTRLETADLQTAGYRTTLKVYSPNPDTVPPVIDNASLNRDTVPPDGKTEAGVTLWASDSYSGVRDMEVRISNPATGETRVCTDEQVLPGLSMYCGFAFDPPDVGTWTVESVRVRDMASNVLVLLTVDIQAAGFPTQLTVKAP